MRRRCLTCRLLIVGGSYCESCKPYGKGWPALRKIVLERDAYRCQIQGPHCTGSATTADHINGNSGDNRFENLRASCRECNSSKGGLA